LSSLFLIFRILRIQSFSNFFISIDEFFLRALENF